MNTNEVTTQVSTESVARFFTKWFYCSVILILIGIVLAKTDIPIEFGFLKHIVKLLSELISSIGIAVFVGNIFTFTISTDDFMEFIREKLVRVVISKDFITQLNIEERKDVMKMILKPPKELSNVYSGITEYFNKYVDDSMSLFKSIYRSNLVINALVTYDTDKNVIKVEQDLNYRVYKFTDDYDKLRIGFEDETSQLIETKIVAPGGEEAILPLNEDDKATFNDPTIRVLYNQSIPDNFKKYKHLNVIRRIVEYGNDHWHSYSYKAIHPCDGLIINIICNNNIKVKSCITYGIQQNFKINDNGSSVKISCNDWLAPGFGLNLILALPCHSDDVSGQALDEKSIACRDKTICTQCTRTIVAEQGDMPCA